MMSKEEKLKFKLEKIQLKKQEAELNEQIRRETKELKRTEKEKGRRKQETKRNKEVGGGVRESIHKEIEESTPIKIPSWYLPVQRRELKDRLIKQYVDEYRKPVTIAGETHAPTQKDIKEYLSLLTKASIKDLQLMCSMKDYTLKLDPLDRLKSIDKKKTAVITIFNDNKTTDTGVCNCYSRTFSRSGMSYIVMSDRAIYDPEFKMAHLYYFANNPFPILFDKSKSKSIDAVADAKLMDDTIEMKVIEALANIDIDKKINLLLFFVAITMFVGVINLVLTLKATGVIGGG